MKRSKLYEILIIFLLYLTVFQDIGLGILYNFTGQQGLVKVLFFTKDILMVLLFIWALFKRKYPIKLFLFFVIYFGILIFQSVVAINKGVPIFNVLSSIRGWLLMPCLITIGFAISNRKFFYRHFRRFIGPFMIVVAIFGLIDFVLDSYVTSTLPFWNDVVGLGKFMEDIKGQDTLFGLPGNFYGQYGGEFFSQKRLVSFWGGPLTSGYVFSIPVLYYFYKALNPKGDKWNKKYLLCFLIVALALVCTFTRTIILTVAVMIVVVLVIKGRKRERRIVFFIAPLVLAYGIFSFNKILDYIYDGSLIEHINQFTTSFSQITLFGEGMATFGVHSSIGTESVYITSIGQNGLIFLILYVFGNIYPLYLITKPKKRVRRNIMFSAVFCVGVIMVISGFVSEQLIAYTSIAPYYVILGFLAKHSARLCKKKAPKKKKDEAVSEGEIVYA